MAPSLSNGLKTRSQGRARRLSVDRRHASEALPCKSFEPIGRHALIYALPDWIVGPYRLGARLNPTPCSEGLLPLPLSREARVSYSSSTVIKSPEPWRPFRSLSGFRNCLIFLKSSLLRHDDSLIAQKYSLFPDIGNLPLSL